MSAFRQALLLKKIQQFDVAEEPLTLEKTWIADRSIILTGQIYELNLKDKEKAISKYMQILNDYKSSIYAEPICNIILENYKTPWLSEKFIIYFYSYNMYWKKLLVPMDLTQNDHLKSYGIAFFALKNNNINVEWLLNYRVGLFNRCKGIYNHRV